MRPQFLRLYPQVNPVLFCDVHQLLYRLYRVHIAFWDEILKDSKGSKGSKGFRDFKDFKGLIAILLKI